MSKKEKRYQVHVYRIQGTQIKPKTIYTNDSVEARQIAFDQFNKPDVYKVKVWDTDEGMPQPNNDRAPGLRLILK